MKKITINKEKIKAWAKEHWVELATAGVAVGTVAAVMIFGRDKDNIDPFVIDLNKDDWKDQLKTNLTIDNKTALTVRQAEAVCCYDELQRGMITEWEGGPKTLRHLDNILIPTLREHPNAKINGIETKGLIDTLDTIDGFFIKHEESMEAEKSA